MNRLRCDEASPLIIHLIIASVSEAIFYGFTILSGGLLRRSLLLAMTALLIGKKGKLKKGRAAYSIKSPFTSQPLSNTLLVGERTSGFGSTASLSFLGEGQGEM